MHQHVTHQLLGDHTMSRTIDANLIQNVANIVEKTLDTAGKETVGPDLLLLKRLVFFLGDAPILFQFLEGRLLIEVLRYTVELDSFNEVFAHLHHGVPAGDALNQSLVFSRLLQSFNVTLKRLW